MAGIRNRSLINRLRYYPSLWTDTDVESLEEAVGVLDAIYEIAPHGSAKSSVQQAQELLLTVINLQEYGAKPETLNITSRDYD